MPIKNTYFQKNIEEMSSAVSLLCHKFFTSTLSPVMLAVHYFPKSHNGATFDVRRANLKLNDPSYLPSLTGLRPSDYFDKLENAVFKVTKNSPVIFDKMSKSGSFSALIFTYISY
jgi:hypothetical protein